jgi:pimeloyl-ACP methyl ester carboxylesterase
VGKSTYYQPGSTPYEIVDLVDDAIEILDAYQLEKAHFVGMSLGGLVSQIAALKYTDRVSSLTLISTGPWGDSDPQIPEMDTRIVDFQAKASTVDWTNEQSVVSYLLEGAMLMSGQKPFDKKRAEKVISAEFNRAGNYISMFNHAALQGGEDFYNRLHEITQPALIIHGTEDLIWHYKHTKVLSEKLKHAALLVLEGTGHELHQQDWDIIISAIAGHANKQADMQ